VIFRLKAEATGSGSYRIGFLPDRVRTSRLAPRAYFGTIVVSFLVVPGATLKYFPADSTI
jgi:hypothetical protein